MLFDKRVCLHLQSNNSHIKTHDYIYDYTWWIVSVCGIQIPSLSFDICGGMMMLIVVVGIFAAYCTRAKQQSNMALDFAATYKVLVLGDSNVGKTCIVHRYCDERYYDTYISTIGNCTCISL